MTDREAAMLERSGDSGINRLIAQVEQEAGRKPLSRMEIRTFCLTSTQSYEKFKKRSRDSVILQAVNLIAERKPIEAVRLIQEYRKKA